MDLLPDDTIIVSGRVHHKWSSRRQSLRPKLTKYDMNSGRVVYSSWYTCAPDGMAVFTTVAGDQWLALSYGSVELLRWFFLPWNGYVDCYLIVLCNGLFTLLEMDSGTDSNWDSQPNANIVLCRTCSHCIDLDSHPYSLFLYRTGIRVRVRTPVLLRQCKWPINSRSALVSGRDMRILINRFNNFA